MSTTFIDITIANKRPPAFEQPAPGFSINQSGSCYLNKSFFDVANIPNKGTITVEWSERLLMVRLKFSGKGAFNNSAFSLPADVRRDIKKLAVVSVRNWRAKAGFRLNHIRDEWYYFRLFDEQTGKALPISDSIILTPEEETIIKVKNQYVTVC